MNLTEDELSLICDALTMAIDDLIHDGIKTPLYDNDPEGLADAKAYIDSMTALQSRIHAELFPKEQT
jgi:hypothetical protein